MARPHFVNGYRWWTTEEIAALTSLYPSAPKDVIQKTITRSWQAIREAAKQRGMSRIVRAQRIQTPISHDFFKIWTADMAYVLGFWFADGYITRGDPSLYSIGFRSKDYEHLVSVRTAMQSEHRIYDKRDGSYELVISSKTIWGDMRVLGCLSAKSLITVWPNIPCTFLLDFVRGEVDGDGSLGFDGRSRVPWFQIFGTRAFLEGLARQVYNATGITGSKVYQSKTKCPFIKYTGLKAKCMAAWLYTDSLLSLERKYLLAMEFLRWRPRRFGFKQRVITPQMERLFGEVLYG